VKKLLKTIDQNVYSLAFFVSAGAVIASFILSNIIGFIPCDLCWYQRILMFPLPVILGVAILRGDKHAYAYVLPLSIFGAVIGLYQSLLQWDIISESTLTCSLTSGSCAEPEVLLLGFLTIPFGAFLSFMAINFLMWRAKVVAGSTAVTKKGQQQLQGLILLVATLAVIAIALVKLFE
jgi:disulfide bond formation protein DsbB